MTKPIPDVLKQLDPQNANHWTADGLPKLETVRFLAGDNSISREAVTAALPGFTRATAQASPDAAAEPPAAQAPAAPAAQQGAAAAEPGATLGAAPENALAGPAGAATGADNGTAETGDGSTQAEKATARAEAEDDFAVAQRVYDAALQAKEAADREFAEATAALDACIERREQAQSKVSHAETVKSYHATQAANRLEQARRRLALKGVDLKEILPQRAKIDESFKRPTGFGNHRPRG